MVESTSSSDAAWDGFLRAHLTTEPAALNGVVVTAPA
jgi:hypothetical protein